MGLAAPTLDVTGVVDSMEARAAAVAALQSGELSHNLGAFYAIEHDDAVERARETLSNVIVEKIKRGEIDGKQARVLAEAADRLIRRMSVGVRQHTAASLYKKTKQKDEYSDDDDDDDDGDGDDDE